MTPLLPRPLLPLLLALVASLPAAACEEPVEVDPAVTQRPLPAPDAPIDTALAAAGAELFDRQCVACHVLEGEGMIGPSLGDVADRREPAWILAMILHPDSMLRTDSITQRLWQEYQVPMIDTGLDEARGRAVLEYLRAVARDGAPGVPGVPGGSDPTVETEGATGGAE